MDSIKERIEEIARNKNLFDIEFEYLLVNKSDINKVIAVIKDQKEDIYSVTLENENIRKIDDWTYNVDDDIFKYLENDYEIKNINIDSHYNIWCQTEDIINEIKHKVGLQKYLEYCKKNHIDYKVLQKRTNVEEFPDLMNYYNEDMKKFLEKQSEISYISFILGYDFLNKMFTNSEVQECDINYDFANYLSNKFMETAYYKNSLKSTYDSLCEWIEENEAIIKSEFLFFTEQENKVILEIGKRKEQNVALVENYLEDGKKEYIIAFNYEVEDKKVNWSYGYYYNGNLEKAREDFEYVKSGGSLYNTFDNNFQKNKEREI